MQNNHHTCKNEQLTKAQLALQPFRFTATRAGFGSAPRETQTAARYEQRAKSAIPGTSGDLCLQLMVREGKILEIFLGAGVTK